MPIITALLAHRHPTVLVCRETQFEGADCAVRSWRIICFLGGGLFRRVAHRGGRGKRAKTNGAGSLLVKLGLLCYFNCANFFIECWLDAKGAAGVRRHLSSLQVILSLGIRFCTFQTLSYSMDFYRGNLKSTTFEVVEHWKKKLMQITSKAH